MSNTDMRASLTVTADASALVAEMRKGSEGLREIRRESEAAARAAALAASEQGRMAEKLNQTFSGFGAGQKSARASADVFAGRFEAQAFERERTEQAARAYRAVEESLNPLIRAERELAEAQSVVNRAVAAGQTTNVAAARTLQQLQDRYNGLVRAQSPAAQSARVFEAAVAADVAEIRQLTLQLDPAARAAAEFARVQDLVSRSIAARNITTAEGARLLKLYSERQQGVAGAGGGAGRFYTGNIMAQGFDVGVTAVMGMSPGMIGLQQGTQLAQVVQGMGGGMTAVRGIASGLLAILSPLNLVTIGFTALAAVGIQGLMKLLPSTKTTAEVMDALAVSVDRVKEVAGEARRSMVDLAKEFGAGAEDAQKLLDLMTEIELRSARRSSDAAVKNVSKELGGGWSTYGYEAGSAAYLMRLFDEGSFSTRMFPNAKGAPGSYKVLGAIGDLDKAQKSDDLNAQIVAAKALEEAVLGAAKASGKITEEEDKWLGQIAELIQGLTRIKAIKENAAGKSEAEAIFKTSQQQLQIEQASLKFGESSAEVRKVQNAHELAALKLKLQELRIDENSLQGKRAINALIAVQFAREQQVKAAKEEQARSRQDAVDAANRELAMLGATAAQQIRANARAAVEIEIRKEKLGLLEAEERRAQAIAKAEAEIAVERGRAARALDLGRQMDQFDLRKGLARDPRVRADIEYEQEYTRQISTGAEEAQARGEADRARAKALNDLTVAQDKFLQSQDAALSTAKLELALLGQSAEVRGRVLALVEAERQIRATGASGEIAETMRRNALEQSAYNREIERGSDAWGKVQAAGENAIDAILGKLKRGDIGGALADLAGDIEKTLFELSVVNPLKNSIMGTNLGTMAEVGGLSGIWARLTGKAPQIDERAVAAEAATVASNMMVEAANVVITGRGAMSFLAGPSTAANSASAPGSFSGLGGKDGVQAQAWQFFAAKGLKPHQIAGIMGNISAESAFNPLAVGDNGQAYGLFQHNDRKGRLFDYIGGRGNLGDVNRQLEFAWQELMTSENPAYKRLLAAKDARGATEAFLGFERPRGFSVADPTGSDAYAKRVAAAEAALAKFGTATQSATTELGTLGNGMGVFGSALQGFATGGKEGALSGVLGGLGQLVAGALGIPGFAAGGDHLGGLRIVGERGPELEFTGPSRIVNAELTRQLLSSRGSNVANVPTAPVDTRPVIQIVNNSSAQVTGEAQETTDARGQRQSRLVLSDAVAEGMTAAGGRGARTLRGMGVTPPVRRRSA